MFPGAYGGHAATRRTLNESHLEEVGLVDVFDRILLLPHSDRQCGEANRSSTELLTDNQEDRAVKTV